MSLPGNWFKGMSEAEKKGLIHSIKTSEIIPRLLSILEEWERELYQTRKDYDNPAWAYRQAHENGMQEAYNRVKRLFDHKE